MLRAFVRYLVWLRQSKEAWLDRQFFEPMLTGAAAACRLAIGAACVLFFASWFGSLPNWIGDDGPLNLSTSRFLILDGIEGSGSTFRLSPFYWNESFVTQTIILLAGAISSLVLVTGYGGRIVPLIVWLLMLTILHRLSMIQSQGDLLLCSIVPYLIIDNGWLAVRNRVGFSDNEKRWTTRLMIGLLRWHLLLWLMVSLASHLSQEMWWNGTAIWKLAFNDVSPLFTKSFVSSVGWMSPVLGSCWLILHCAVIITLLFENLRPLCIPVSIFFWLGIYLLNGDMLYAVVGIAATSCVFYESTIIVREVLQQPLDA